MATNLIEDQIKDRITRFIAELDALVRKSALEAVRGVLENGAAAPTRRGRPAKAGRGPGRPASGGAADAIVAHVKANDGQTVGEIVRGTGLAPAAAKKAIAKLLAEGALSKTGQRRGTRYHAGSGAPAPAAGKRGKRGRRRGRKKAKAA